MLPVDIGPLLAQSDDEELLPRIEEKFLVPAEFKPPFLEALSRRLKRSYPHLSTRYTMIESVYLDSDAMDLLRDHFLSPDRRFKVRTRRYGPNGDWIEDEAMLEMKCKNGRVSTKPRFEVDPESLKRILSGKGVELTQDLGRRNQGLNAGVLEHRLACINTVLRTWRLKPASRILYRRHAFAEVGLRVTLDDRLECRLLRPVRDSRISPMLAEMRRRFLERDYFILEVKHSGSFPDWLRDLLRSRGADAVSFSKYCFAASGGLE